LLEERVTRDVGEAIATVVFDVLTRVVRRNAPNTTIGDILDKATQELEMRTDGWQSSQGPHNCSLVTRVLSNDPIFEEPLNVWAHYAFCARQLLEIACQLKRFEETTLSARHLGGAQQRLDDLWEKLTPDSIPLRTDAALGGWLGAHRSELLLYVHEWITLGNIRLTLAIPPSSDEPQRSTAGHSFSLFGCLGVQLRALILGIEQLACCQNCLGYFIPPARTGSKRNRLCATCRASNLLKNGYKRAARVRQRERADEISALLGLAPDIGRGMSAATIRRLILSDNLWAELTPYFSSSPRPGPRGVGDREILTGILFIIASQHYVNRDLKWAQLPQELGCGSGGTCHRHLGKWLASGVWHNIRSILEPRLDGIIIVNWEKAERRGRHPSKAGPP